MEEKWKPIRGFHGWYEVSNLGRVRSPEGRVTSSKQSQRRVWRERILKQKARIRPGGYERYDLYVSLRRNGKSQNYLVSRFVAKAFCPGYRKGLTANHIDGDSTNNRADNLEWATYEENVHHYINGGFVKGYRGCSLTFPDGTVKHYISLAHASRDIGRCRSYIVNKLLRNKPIYTIDGREVKVSDDHRGHKGETESHHQDPD
jgi:hypothetical protein